MNTIELIVTASSIIVALCIALGAFVILKPRKEQTVAKEQVTIEASIESYDETPKLKARIEFLEAEIEKFATICDGLTVANKKYLDEFEAYVKLVEGK